MSPTPELIALARAAAAKHALDGALVCAVVEQESAWDTHGIRYEPGFRTRYVAPLGLPPTEEIARSISWGLMQVMGQVAREHGFQGKFLSALCEPAAGLDIGCAVLASKIAAAHAHPRDVIPNPAPTNSVGDEERAPGSTVSRAREISQGSAFASGAEIQQQIPRTAGRPLQDLEREEGRPSARDDTFSGLTASQGQGITLDENLVAHALELWNGGANPDYAAQVLARLAHYK